MTDPMEEMRRIHIILGGSINPFMMDLNLLPEYVKSLSKLTEADEIRLHALGVKWE
jgi:hypothetical protein